MSAPIYILVDTAVELPVNAMPLIDDSDFKSREVSIAYNAAGMDLVWNFVTPAGVITQTAVTPTTAGDYDWEHIGDAMYKIGMPASGGASINNNTEGYGWFSGICNGVLPWVSRTYCFAPANVVNSLVLGSDLLDVNFAQILGTALTESAGGRLKAALTTLLDVASPVFTAASVNQTGDSFARIGANGAGLTDLATAANLATILARQKYEGPRGPGIYYNDAAGNTSTTLGNGTYDNPVSTPAAVMTLAGVVGVKRVYIVNDSSFTAGAAIDDFEFVGIGYRTNILNLNGQTADELAAYNLYVQGVPSGVGEVQFRDCTLNAMPITQGTTLIAHNCFLPSSINLDGNDLKLVDCCSFATSATFTFRTGGGNVSTVRAKRCSIDTVTVAGMTASAGTDEFCFTGYGHVTFQASCTGGTARVADGVKVTNNGAISPTTEDTQAAATAALDAISATALERFRSVDTGATTAVAGSIAKIAQGSAGGSVTVAGFDSAALAQLAGTSVSISSHLAAAQQIEIVQGDDYEDDDDTALTFTFSGITTDLTSATAHLYWERGDTQEDWTALSVTASGDDWIIKFERTAAQTALLTAAKDWKAQLVVIPDGTSRRITLLRTRSARVLDRFDD